MPSKQTKKKKILQNAENQIILPNFFKSININAVNYEDDNALEYINSCDIASFRASMQNFKVQLQKFIANIKIDNVKVKFLIDTRK